MKGVSKTIAASLALANQPPDKIMDGINKPNTATLWAAALTAMATSNVGPLPDFGGGKYEPGTRLGLCKKDGEVFEDSRGRKYVYNKGQIRRVKA